MSRIIGRPAPSLRFRLRFVGWFANCVVWSIGILCFAFCIFLSTSLLVWSWGLWPSIFYAVVLSIPITLALCAASLVLMAFVVLALDTFCSPGVMRLRYATIRIVRLITGVPDDPAAALSWLSTASLPLLHELLSEQVRLQNDDAHVSHAVHQRLTFAKSQLGILSDRLESVLSSPFATRAAAGYLSTRLDSFASPPLLYHESGEVQHRNLGNLEELDDCGRLAPETVFNAQEVFFVLNGRHLVEVRPLTSLDPPQTAMRVLLRDARPLSKYPSVRCMIAPGWLYKQLSTEHFAPPRAAHLPNVSEAQVIPFAQATADILVGLWCPPDDFGRCLAAAATLARLPTTRATARLVV